VPTAPSSDGGNEINRDNLTGTDSAIDEPPCPRAQPPLIRPHPNAPGPAEFAGRFTAVSAHGDNVIALRTDGTVVPLLLTGRIPDFNSYSPLGVTDLVAVSAGQPTNLGIRADHTVIAWGRPRQQQTDPATANLVPPGLHDVIAVAAGYNFGLAITTAPR
jgi:hypothetical protein